MSANTGRDPDHTHISGIGSGLPDVCHEPLDQILAITGVADLRNIGLKSRRPRLNPARVHRVLARNPVDRSRR